MSITNPTLWTAQLGYAADVEEIPNTYTAGTGDISFQNIFPLLTEIEPDAGGFAPKRTSFNALFKLLGDNIYFLQRGGFYSYDAEIEYDNGAIVLHNGLLYLSLDDTNIGHEPGAAGSATYWREFVQHPDLSDYARKSQANTFTQANTFNNSLTVRGNLKVGADGAGGTGILGTVNGYLETTTPPVNDNSKKVATTEFIDRALGNYPATTDIVTLSDNQTLTGQKTFTKQIIANGGIKGTLTGNVTGNVTGDLNGDVTGNVTGSVSGNAGSATKLQTARKITVNVGSTTLNTFDGSKDVTTGITGTLATSHGGTGRTDGLAVSVTKKFTLTKKGAIGYGENNDYLADKAVLAWWDGSYSDSHASNLTYCSYGTIVGTSGNQTIGGTKTFSSPVAVATPTAANHAATKDYVDDKVANISTTDNKMQQNASTANGEYCLLAKSTTATANINGQAIFDADVKLNPSTGTITAKTFKGALSGNATTATTATKANILTTARKITVNVGSTTINTFNGSADFTTGITGTLATAHGGTGRTDGKAAALATARTISLTGGATGSVSFDGSKNVSMAVTLQTSGGVIPTGCVIAWMGSASKIPSGFLLCNGANVSRTTYKNLFNAIGTTYGAGDGSSTFTLPKLNDGRFLEGSTAPGTKRNAGLPNITGVYPYTWPQENLSGLTYQGAAYEATVSSYKGWGASSRISSGVAAFGFDASKSNGLYGDSSKVQPVSLTTLFIIRI